MIEELENKINVLSKQNEKLKAENEYLKQKCKQEYEGFMATICELCDTAIELDKYKGRNEKVITYIDSLFNTIDYKDEEFITFETLENIQKLAKCGLLNGGDDNE